MNHNIVITEQWVEDIVQYWAKNFPRQKVAFEKKLENKRKLLDFDGKMGIAASGDMQLAMMVPDFVDFQIYIRDKKFDSTKSPTLRKHFATYTKKRARIKA